MRDSWLKWKLVAAYEAFYEVGRIMLLHTKYRLRIMTYKETLRYIEKYQCNIARFGDGEFGYLFEAKDPGFQCSSESLKRELLRVLDNSSSKLLICVPRYFISFRGCNEKTKQYWTEWGRNNERQRKTVELLRLKCGKGYVFGDAHITRPYIDQKNSKRAQETYKRLKKLWRNRDVLIVEGEKSRLGVGNDLLSEARSVKRILAPSINAFACYNEIKNAILEHCSNQLVLLALGATATILASDLVQNNIWALDIGHIDVEYEWYTRKANEKIAIPGKYVLEVSYGQDISKCFDQEYAKQIVARVNRNTN